MRNVVVTILTLSVASWACDDHAHDHGHDHDHQAHAHDPPAAYLGMTNPRVDEIDLSIAGASLFSANCARCHGTAGDADGPDATGLTPAAPKLSETAAHAEWSDAYMFWRVTEGGAADPFNSKMPAFGALSEDDRWAIIAYARSLAGIDVRRVKTAQTSGLKVAYAPMTEPIDPAAAFDIEIMVTAPEGAAVPQDLAVAFDGWMTAHGHGFAAVPTLEADAEVQGRYVAKGVGLAMIGHWQLYVDLTTGGETERLTFDLLLH